MASKTITIVIDDRTEVKLNSLVEENRSRTIRELIDFAYKVGGLNKLDSIMMKMVKE